MILVFFTLSSSNWQEYGLLVLLCNLICITFSVACAAILAYGEPASVSEFLCRSNLYYHKNQASPLISDYGWSFQSLLSLLFFHCFGWKPKIKILQAWGRCTSWWRVFLELTSLWWRVFLVFAVWCCLSHSSSVRYLSNQYNTFVNLNLKNVCPFLYKLLDLHSIHLTKLVCFFNFLKNFILINCLIFCLCNPFSWFTVFGSSFMEPNKKSFKSTLLSSVDHVSPTEAKNTGPARTNQTSPSVVEVHNKKQMKGKAKLDMPKTSYEAGESSKSRSKINVASFLNKLSKVKENFQPMEESSLFGFLIGKYVDFKKKTNKLRFDWKNLNGTVEFIDRQTGWFEICFSNPIDKKQIWEGRPYHIFSQLLLLKPWSPSFNPITESIFCVDMWVRILLCPPEYYNFDAISTIVEFNKMGTLLKLDPNANKRNWAKFARFCLNIDCSSAVSREIYIPDENGKLKLFCLWFEDIPQGCGNCGALDHSFSTCPLRKFIPPKFNITFKKPSTKHSLSESQESMGSDEWETIKNKGKKHADVSLENTKKVNVPAKEDFGGIGVLYKTDESSIESQTSHQSAEEVALTTKFGEKSGVLFPSHFPVTIEGFSPIHVTTENAQGADHKMTVEIIEEKLETHEDYLANIQAEMAKEAALEVYYYDDEENDENLVDYIEEEIPCIEGNLGDLNPAVPLPDMTAEELSFFSLNSESSMLKRLSGMEMKQSIPTSTGSSKRKSYGGEGDTASSPLVGNKKPKN